MLAYTDQARYPLEPGRAPNYLARILPSDHLRL
uniref:Uncharacterized protein n=1 Tax=Arundo donax TaxID=35708 RepID=A0A0A8Z7H3_ARUDO